MKRVALAVAAGAVLLACSPLPVVAWTPSSGYQQNTYWAGRPYANQYSTQACTAASAQTWANWTQALTDYSDATQAGILSYEKAHDLGNYAAGSDPRGFAWGVSYRTSVNYNVQDYMFSNQSSANWEIVYNVRASAHPQGAIVEHGHHAILVTGYNTTYDPFNIHGQGNLIYGVYIIDPWYGSGFVGTGMPNWPSRGYAPEWIAAGTWNSSWFFGMVADPDLMFNWGYNQYYSVVLRAPDPGHNVAPRYVPPGTFDSYADHPAGHGEASTGIPTLSNAPRVTNASLERAVREGMATAGISRGEGLGVDLSGFGVGATIHVDSLSADIPPYELVELVKSGQVAAIAMVSDVPGGYELAAIRPVQNEYRLPTAAERTTLAQGHGDSAGTRLVWAVSDESKSPFEPILEATTPSGRPEYLSRNGWSFLVHVAR